MINRRQFLKRSTGTVLGAVSFPYVVTSSVLGKNGNVAPSNRIVIGCIGIGWQGGTNMVNFLRKPDTKVVAVCDVDKKHLNQARNRVNREYDNKDCATYSDFRELVVRKDIDVMSIGLPDHWHSIPSIAAVENGKDIYGEKPLSHTLVEGRAMCKAVERYGRIWQTGSWQRSKPNFRFACELVLNGRIGKITKVEVGLPAGHSDFGKTKGQETPGPAPEHLDYNFWLGPAPWSPYCPARVHKNWRWNYDYGGGQLMDWVGHHVDIAHWGLGFDRTGPVEVEGQGVFPSRSAVWNTATKYMIKTKYANGLPMIIAGGHSEIRGGTKWVGEDGWVWVTRDNIDAHPKSLLKDKIKPYEINLHHSSNHYRNFLDCVKSRKETLTPCETAHRSATPGHLGLIAMMLERKIKWDPKKEQIVGDEEASRMLGKSMRSPWQL